VRQPSSLPRLALALLLSSGGLTLGGCVVRTAADIAAVPVHAAGWTVDKMTTSQSEADRNRGREMRKQEERESKERRRAEQPQGYDTGSAGY
jgi:hypothetical protein